MCSCDYDDGEPAKLFDQRTIRVRKAHVCCECGDEIKKGDECQLTKGLWGTEFEQFYTCKVCARVRRDFCAPYGCLWEDLVEALGVEIL